MQITALGPGYALCEGRGHHRRVNTALVGPLAVGDWVLIFIDSAQERIAPERAHEINMTLDLMEAAMQGGSAEQSLDFELPSAMSLEQIVALSGAQH